MNIARRDLRLLSATLITASAMSVLPALLVLIAYGDHNTWKASSAQGFLFFASSAAFAVAFALIGFPATAALLISLGRLARTTFNWWAFLGLALATIASLLAFALYSGDYSLLFISPATFVLACFIVLPFRALWWRLALGPNNSFKPN